MRYAMRRECPHAAQSDVDHANPRVMTIDDRCARYATMRRACAARVCQIIDVDATAPDFRVYAARL